MRRFLAAIAAMSAALVISVPPVAGAAPEGTGCVAAQSDSWCFFSAPVDWEQVLGGFLACPSCQSYGQQGVEQGHWPDFHCEGRVQGIDYYYDLYIPPGE